LPYCTRQAELLYFAMVDQMKAAVKAKRQDLLAGMRDMPDHNLSVRFSPSWALILHFTGFSRSGFRCPCCPPGCP